MVFVDTTRDIDTKCELLNGLWPLFLIGKVFGLIHLSKNGSKGIRHSAKSVVSIISIIMWATYIMVFVFAIIILVRQLKTSDTNLVEQFMDLVYHVHITLTNTFCIYESKHFPELFTDWLVLEKKLKRLESLLDFVCCKKRGKTWNDEFKRVSYVNIFATNLHQPQSFSLETVLQPMRRVARKSQNLFLSNQSDFVISCWFLIGGYFGLCIIGAVAYFVGVGYRHETHTLNTYLEAVAEVYILKEYCNWWTGIFVLIVGHIMEISWAYGDMLIFFFSYTLCHHVKRYNRTLEIIKQFSPSVVELEHLRVSHWEIALGIKKADEILGLITTTTFACNILYLFSRVYLGLAEDLASPKPALVFEAAFAFIYLIGRIFLSAIMGSNLNQETNRTLTILMKFSEENQKETHYLLMERFCSQVITGNISLTGNGYFILNRNFIASLLSAIATYEIIIIQFSASS